ncbi:uncharacterized protein [Hyperolius riggenbachi]
MLVSQDPNNVTHHPGDTATVTCRWNHTSARRIRVNWTKYSPSEEENGTELSSGLWPSQKNTTTMDHNRSSCTATNNRVSCTVTNDTSVMTLHPVTENDNGLYICHITIEIPVLDAGQGNGTRLHVFHFQGPSGGVNQATWAILCILPAVIIFVLGWFFYNRKKRPKRKIYQTKTEQESLEIRNVDQDNVDADESASSTNSVQWAISTVYESFDYFAMKNNDQKPETCSDAHAACLDEAPTSSDRITASPDETAATLTKLIPAQPTA